MVNKERDLGSVDNYEQRLECFRVYFVEGCKLLRNFPIKCQRVKTSLARECIKVCDLICLSAISSMLGKKIHILRFIRWVIHLSPRV